MFQRKTSGQDKIWPSDAFDPCDLVAGKCDRDFGFHAKPWLWTAGKNGVFRLSLYKERLLPWNPHGRPFAVFTAGCASGAAYAVYDPRIVLAGFTVQGSTAPVSVTPWLAGATYLCFGIFCFLPVMLELYESRKLKQSRKKQEPISE